MNAALCKAKAEKLLLRPVYIVSFVICVAFWAITFDRPYDENAVALVPMVIHTYDSALLNENPDAIAQKNGVISPKYITNHISAFFMKLGLRWDEVCVLYAVLSIVVLSLATVNCIGRLRAENFILCTLLFCFAVYQHTNLAGFGHSNSYVYNDGVKGVNGIFGVFGWIETLSEMLVYLALSFLVGDNKRWNTALALLAFATLFHAGFGAIGFYVAALLYAIELLLNNRTTFPLKGLLLWFAAMLVASAPNALTDTIFVPKQEWSQVFPFFQSVINEVKEGVTLKHNKLLGQCLIFAFTALFFWNRQFKTIEQKRIRWMLIALPLSWLFACFAILVGGAFHSTLILKLPLLRCALFPSFMLLLLLIKRFDELFTEKSFTFALILFAVLSYNNGWYYFAPYILIYFMLKDSSHKIALWLLGLLLTLLWSLFLIKYVKPEIYILANSPYLWALTAMALFPHFASNFKNKRFVYAAVPFIILLAVVNKADYNRTAVMKKLASPEIYNLSVRFKAISQPEDSILTPVGWNDGKKIGFIPLIAERNIYTSGRPLPHTIFGMREKYVRTAAARDFNAKTPEWVYDFMNEIGCKYLLMINPPLEFTSSPLFKSVLTEGKYLLFEKIEVNSLNFAPPPPPYSLLAALLILLALCRLLAVRRPYIPYLCAYRYKNPPCGEPL